MIEQEVMDAVGDPTDDGSRLNRMADEFRSGRDTAELMALLHSDNSELVSIGAWILGEPSVELYDSEKIVARLRELTGHAEPTVRFHAFGAIFPFLRFDDPASHELVDRMRNDPNKGVRISAEAAARSLGL